MSSTLPCGDGPRLPVRDEAGPEIWGGVECSVVRIGDVYRDQTQQSGHYAREGDLERLAWLGVSALRVPILWEHAEEPSLGGPHWERVDRQMTTLRALGIRPIVGLLHHGSGPRTTSLVDPGFAEQLASFAGRVAARYPWVTDFTPINEPLTTARFSALYGHWYPHARSTSEFLRALLNQCKAIVASMRAIRAVIPGARLVQTEDFAHVTSTPLLAYQAEYENHRRFLSLDLLSGRVDTSHPLHRHLLENGIGEGELEERLADPVTPDVIGINYYVTSERFLDERIARYPASLAGGNGRHTYADVETVRVAKALTVGHAGALAAMWARYGRPLALTEVHMGCTREEQLRWWAEAYRAVLAARTRGIDARALTAWALFGSFDWDSLMVRSDGRYEAGAFDLGAPSPRPTALARAIRTRALDHPVLDTPGWWRRPSRPAPAARPVLIAGGGGLGQALARACDARGIEHRLMTRSELHVADPAQVTTLMRRHRPWAVIDAAGPGDRDPSKYARRPSREVVGALVLARACAAAGAQFVAFSSDAVFDGRGQRPYVESDPVGPIDACGRDLVNLERAVLEALPQALVVRCGVPFESWDGSGFLSSALRALTEGHELAALPHAIVSPVYVPDLAHAVLDLVVDAEAGLWHLANPGAVSWPDFARLAARACRIPAGRSSGRCVDGFPRRNGALDSERACMMRPLEAALDDFARAFTDGRAPLQSAG